MKESMDGGAGSDSSGEGELDTEASEETGSGKFFTSLMHGVGIGLESEARALLRASRNLLAKDCPGESLAGTGGFATGGTRLPLLLVARTDVDGSGMADEERQGIVDPEASAVI